MSDKLKFPRDQALVVATQMLAVLRPHCERIEIAGSLRRGKREVGDIEMLFIPKTMQARNGLFDFSVLDQAATAIDKLVADGVLEKRLNTAGRLCAWGPLNKLARHVESGIPIDFFSTTPENWAVSLVVRTGSRETNLRLTIGAQKLNRSLNAYGCGITCRDTGEIIPAASEEEVFSLCGIQYLQPHQR